MSRPVDWSPVGLDIDPTPGDPVYVLTGGREYLDVADSINEAAAAMARLDVDGAVSQAVDALMDRKEDTIAEIRKVHARYQAAGDALVSYASTLEQVQADTLAALQRARGAHADAADAARTQHYDQDLAESETDAAQKTAYKHKADSAQGGAASAQHAIAAAQDDITAAVHTRDRAADRAADQITEITSHDGLHDSWWDNWGSKLVAALADIADLVSTIAGVLAVIVAFIPVVGQALAGVLIVIAAVAAIVSALANIALAATGERSWGEAGIAIAGAALSVIGLGSAAKAATGISKAAFKAGARETMVGLQSAGKGGLKGFGKNAWCKVGFGTCFTAGTLVRTPDGDKPIDDLRAGDKVWCYDQHTGVKTLETVEETFVRTTTTLHHLTIGGAVVTTTADHPFMVAGMGWIQAADLRPGDRLVTADDGTVALDEIRVETLDESDAVTVYNIHVRAHHTYYVYAGDRPVLVHNMAGHELPQGLTSEVFDEFGRTVRSGTSHISDDIVIQGSRAAHTARATSDIDIAVRMRADDFDQFVAERFGSPRPGSAKERTMLHAIATGKVQAGEAGLRPLRKQIERLLGMDVDISAIKVGGPFDNPPLYRGTSWLTANLSTGRSSSRRLRLPRASSSSRILAHPWSVHFGS